MERHPEVTYFVAGQELLAVLEAAVEGCDIVFNLANTRLPAVSNSNIGSDVQSVVEFNIRLIELCLKHRIGSYVFASSGGTVYGQAGGFPISEESATNPVVAYGVHKLLIEKYLHLYNHTHSLNYRVLRIANPYGPGQSPFVGQGIVARYIYTALSGEEFIVFGDGSVVRDYIYIDDVSRAFEAAALYQGRERIFNVGYGRGVSIKQLMGAMDQILGCKPKFKYVEQRSTDVSKNYLDIRRLSAECGWSPKVSLEEGLTKTIDWIRHRFHPQF